MSTEAFDMTDTIIPRSDQINAEDILTGPVTITITGVTRGNAEQPVNMVTAEFGPGRPYKPSKTMRRVIVNAWGKDASAYVGRRIKIYRDPEVKFGPDKVGGIKISHLSHIDKRLEIALTVTRGRRAQFAVDPLPDEAPPSKAVTITPEAVAEFERDIAAANTIQELDEVAKELKACDLGAHREHLLSTWSDRRSVVSKPETQPAQEK